METAIPDTVGSSSRHKQAQAGTSRHQQAAAGTSRHQQAPAGSSRQQQAAAGSSRQQQAAGCISWVTLPSNLQPPMAGLLPALRRGIVAGREVVTLRNAHMAVSVVPGGEAGGRADPRTGCPVVLLSWVCLCARPTVLGWLVCVHDLHCVRGRGLSVCACACAGVVCLRPVCSHPCAPVSAAGSHCGSQACGGRRWL